MGQGVGNRAVAETAKGGGRKGRDEMGCMNRVCARKRMGMGNPEFEFPLSHHISEVKRARNTQFGMDTRDSLTEVTESVWGSG